MRTSSTALYRSEFNEIWQIHAGVYLIERTDARFEDLSQIDDEYAALVAALRRAKPRSVLLDLRRTRGRNDPGFEEALAEHRRRMLSITKNTIILVESAIGQLQVKRHMEHDGLDHVHVVRDESQARALALSA